MLKKHIGLAVIMLSALSGTQLVQASTANNAASFACQSPQQVSEEQFKSLVTLGEQLITGETQLQLPANCPSSVKINDKELANPFVAALQVAAKQQSQEDFAQVLNQHITPQLDIAARADEHSTLLRYLRVACGTELACVSYTIRQIPLLDPKESPIFCAFTRFADYTVQAYFQNPQAKSSYPVACLGNSALTAGSGLSPMQDWFEAYKLLGK